MSGKSVLLALLVTTLVACERETADAPAPVAAVKSAPAGPVVAGPVVVSAFRPKDLYLPGMFVEFTDLTGIRVQVQYPDNPPADGPATRQAHRDYRPGDVMLSYDLAGAWTVADTGDLRPLGSSAINDRVPAALRDGDGYWAPLAVRFGAIAYDSHSFGVDDVRSFEQLADEKFRGKLCLSTGRGILRALVATMIENQGQRPAELLVRGWMANLAAAPFQNDDEFRTAFAAGTCGAALVTLSGPDVPAATGTLAYYRPLPAVIDMEVLGILRHAEHPEAARLFAEWLVNEAEYPGKWRAEDADDLAPGTVSAVGWRTMDAVRLLERVGLN